MRLEIPSLGDSREDGQASLESPFLLSASGEEGPGPRKEKEYGNEEGEGEEKLRGGGKERGEGGSLVLSAPSSSRGEGQKAS